MNADHGASGNAADRPEVLRARMVATQLRARNIRDERILAAFEKVPRHWFCPGASLQEAYDDHPCGIGHHQTVSQPYMVAWMLEAARLKPSDRVLEIGTGSGYQTALLAQLVGRIFSVERIPELLHSAEQRLRVAGVKDVAFGVGDGSVGWPAPALFDCILVTAGAPSVPEPLRQQLAVGGRLLAPVGPHARQELIRVERLDETRYREESLGGCVFVPLIGTCGWPD